MMAPASSHSTNRLTRRNGASPTLSTRSRIVRPAGQPRRISSAVNGVGARPGARTWGSPVSSVTRSSPLLAVSQVGIVVVLELAGRFYEEVLRPAIEPTRHAAARVGSGSDVLSLDTPRSTDHGWGPRCHVFVEERDVDAVRDRIEAALPQEFLGWAIRFGWDDVPVQHHVEAQALGRWLLDELAVDPRGGLTNRDWLLMPQQQLLHVTAGEAFHDDAGELTDVPERSRGTRTTCGATCSDARGGGSRRRRRSSGGRPRSATSSVADRRSEARTRRDASLCFLLERRYAPYTKWLGSAFARLDAAHEFRTALERALSADGYEEREAGLVVAYEGVAGRFNVLGVVPTVEAPTARTFYSGRSSSSWPTASPMHASRRSRIRGSARCRRPAALDQYLDSTDALYPERSQAASGMLTAEPRPTLLRG